VSEHPQYTRVSWDELGDMQLAPLQDDHPWPRRDNLTLRVFSVPLQCAHLAFSVGRLEPGQSVYHHHHREAEEIYLLVGGRSQIRIEDEVIEATPFDAFRIPPQLDRSVYNNSHEPCWWVFIGAPLDEFVEKPTYSRS
jgi:quercetin dioxygenase-like cupin family protein